DRGGDEEGAAEARMAADMARGSNAERAAEIEREFNKGGSDYNFPDPGDRNAPGEDPGDDPGVDPGGVDPGGGDPGGGDRGGGGGGDRGGGDGGDRGGGDGGDRGGD